jgi:hypothetical protein
VSGSFGAEEEKIEPKEERREPGPRLMAEPEKEGETSPSRWLRVRIPRKRAWKPLSLSLSSPPLSQRQTKSLSLSEACRESKR